VNRADEMVARAVHWSLGTVRLHDARRVIMCGFLVRQQSSVDGINLLLKSVFGVGSAPSTTGVGTRLPNTQRRSGSRPRLQNFEGRIHEDR